MPGPRRHQLRKRLAAVLAVLTATLALAPAAMAAVTVIPLVEPTAEPTPEPKGEPTAEPTAEPKAEPTPEPKAVGTAKPKPDPGKKKISSKGKAQKSACDKDDGGSAFGPPMPPSVECMTERAVRTIFGMPKGGWVVKPVLKGILEIPDFVETPARGVGDAEWLAEAIGFALLLGVVTFTMLHFWAAGMTSQGGSGLLLDGVMRCTGAGMLILAWPFVFENVGKITNAVSAALLPAHSVDVSIAAMTAAGTALGAAGGGGWGALLGLMAVVTAFLVLFIGLLLMKIGLLAGLLVAFVGMPIALAIWPIPSLAAPASYGIRFVGMVFSVTIMWALCFKVFGAVNTQFVFIGKELTGAKKLILPLVGIAELAALFAIPRHAVAMWNVAPGRGTVSSIATHAAANWISSKAGQFGKGGGSQGGAGGRAGGLGSAGRAGQNGGSGTGGGRPAGNGGNGNANGRGNANPSSNANGNGRGGQQGQPGPSSNGSGNAGGAAGRVRPTTIGANGLPRPAKGDAEGEKRAKAMQKAALERRREEPPGRATVGAAIRQISAAEGGRYAQPLRAALSGGGSDGEVSWDMSMAAATPGLGAGVNTAFERIAAATPDTRREALETLQPTAPPPQPPPPRNDY
jgi:hypothetical protein